MVLTIWVSGFRNSEKFAYVKKYGPLWNYFSDKVLRFFDCEFGKTFVVPFSRKQPLQIVLARPLLIHLQSKQLEHAVN